MNNIPSILFWILPFVILKLAAKKPNWFKHIVTFQAIAALSAMFLYEISNVPERIPEPFRLPMRFISEWITYPVLLTIPLALLLRLITAILKLTLNSINWIQSEKMPVWIRWSALVIFMLWFFDLIISTFHAEIFQGMKSHRDSVLWIPRRYPWVYWFVLPSEAITLLRMKNEQGMWLRPQRCVEFLIRIVEWFFKK